MPTLRPRASLSPWRRRRPWRRVRLDRNVRVCPLLERQDADHRACGDFLTVRRDDEQAVGLRLRENIPGAMPGDEFDLRLRDVRNETCGQEAGESRLCLEFRLKLRGGER